MGTLFLSLGLWCVVLHSLRVALFGNPLHLCLQQAGPDTLCRADQVASEGRDPADEQETRFLRQFSRLTVLGSLLFMLEIALLVTLIATHQLIWLCGLLLLKNIVLAAMSLSYAAQADNDFLFRSLASLPRWVMVLDRLSGLASGVGLLIAFLDINGLHLWK